MATNEPSSGSLRAARPAPLPNPGSRGGSGADDRSATTPTPTTGGGGGLLKRFFSGALPGSKSRKNSVSDDGGFEAPPPASQQPPRATHQHQRLPSHPRADTGLGIACCPLQPEDYASAWERQRRTLSAARGPLPTTLAGVLADSECLPFYEKFLRRQRQHARLAFVLEARDFAAMPVSGAPGGDSESNDDDDDDDERRMAAAAIYAQFLAPQGPSSLGFDEATARALQERVFDDETELPADLFASLAAASYAQLDHDFPAFLDGFHYHRFCIGVLAQQPSLRAVLSHDLALMVFTEFLEQHRARKVVQFWLAAEHFREGLAGRSAPADTAAAASDAMGLYSRFFSLQAEDPLGVDEATRVSVEANICLPGGPQADCFSRAQDLAYTALSEYFLPRFLASDAYNRFMHDFHRKCEGLLRELKAAAASAADHSVAADDKDEPATDAARTRGALLVLPLPVARRGRPPAHSLGAVDEYGVYTSARELLALPAAITSDPNFAFVLPTRGASLGARMRSAMARRTAAAGDSSEARTAQFLAMRTAQQLISDTYRVMRVCGTIDPTLFSVPSRPVTARPAAAAPSAPTGSAAPSTAATEESELPPLSRVVMDEDPADAVPA